ncbi:MAG: hypothetical protein HC880_02815 [Bacteroidia bacterium]|nr:hypothetical protein [Bacteroidia bacterium]
MDTCYLEIYEDALSYGPGKALPPNPVAAQGEASILSALLALLPDQLPPPLAHSG